MEKEMQQFINQCQKGSNSVRSFWNPMEICFHETNPIQYNAHILISVGIQ